MYPVVSRPSPANHRPLARPDTGSVSASFPRCLSPRPYFADTSSSTGPATAGSVTRTACLSYRVPATRSRARPSGGSSRSDRHRRDNSPGDLNCQDRGACPRGGAAWARVAAGSVTARKVASAMRHSDAAACSQAVVPATPNGSGAGRCTAPRSMSARRCRCRNSGECARWQQTLIVRSREREEQCLGF